MSTEICHNINLILQETSEDALRRIEALLRTTNVFAAAVSSDNGATSPSAAPRAGNSPRWPSTQERRVKVEQLLTNDFFSIKQLAKTIQRDLGLSRQKTRSGEDRLQGQVGNDVYAFKRHGCLEQKQHSFPAEYRITPGHLGSKDPNFNWRIGK
jgi:hypothetical protein